MNIKRVIREVLIWLGLKQRFSPEELKVLNKVAHKMARKEEKHFLGFDHDPY